MNKTIKNCLILVLLISMLSAVLVSCSSSKETIVIYSSSEEFRNVTVREMLKNRFPDYNIDLQTKSTGDIAAALAAEGVDTEADIILELESTYMRKPEIEKSLATLSDIDFSRFCDELVPENHKFVPFTRMSGAVIIDEAALAKKGASIPQSYDDLLKPEYKGLISMPNPKTSGTGYIFLLSLVNERGEAAALEYFDALEKNISGGGFTTSGSGPVAALNMGEAAIALGMTFQAVSEINKGAKYTIKFFDEGAPYTTYSSAVVKGRESDEKVMEVFKYIVDEVTPNDKKLYIPEKIYENTDYTIKNYPSPIPYANMENLTDINFKESLLEKWKY